MKQTKAPITWSSKNIYPKTPTVRRIYSADVSRLPKVTPSLRPGRGPSAAGEQAMFAALQGLVNRVEPRVYLCYSKSDHLWVDYYEKRFKIKTTRLRHPYELFELFGDLVDGAIVYDPRMQDTFNLAVMLAGRHNCLPVTPKRRRELSRQYAWAGNVVDDLRGRFKNEYELNLWAHQNLQPSCNRHIVVHQRGVQAVTIDYVIAHNLFLFHACHSMKDRKEAALVDAVYQSMARPGHVMGWLDRRTIEIEYTARIARNGCFETCNVCPNLSLHAGIDAKPKCKPRKLAAAQKKAAKKVYVTYVASDGDALWALNGFFFGNFNSPKRGRFPLAWETQILAYHLAPGMLQYYVDKLTGSDALIASTSGAGYTYPNLHPDPASYLKHTEKYMKLTGVRQVFAGVHNPYQCMYWGNDQEMHEKLAASYRRNVPSAEGVVYSYGAGGLVERHSVEPGRAPFVCFTTNAGNSKDILKETTKAIAAVDRRPLFVSVHLTNTRGPVPEAMCRAVKALRSAGHEVVLPDEWFAKIRSAAAKGWLAGGLYPTRDRIIADRQAHAIAHWNSGLRRTFEKVLKKSVLPNSTLAKMSPKAFPAIWGSGQARNEKKRTVTTLADDLAFSVLFTAQVLAGLVADCRGCYTKDLTTLRRFVHTDLKHIRDATVLAECLTAWLQWEKKIVTIPQAKSWARRMLKLLPRLDLVRIVENTDPRSRRRDARASSS